MMEFLLEPFYRAICFPLGWPVIKLISWGKYPGKGAWFAQRTDSEWTAATGAAVLVIAMMVALRQF